MPPPPSYDEVNDMFASTSADQSVNSVDFFLGEVGIVLYKKKYNAKCT
jgi:hypothetical protein